MSLLQALSASLGEGALPAAQEPINLLADASGVVFQRASSPLRKHKRKNAPQRSALDVAEQEPSSLAPLVDDSSDGESFRKERRGSASPDPYAAAALAAVASSSSPPAQPAARPQRPQRAAAQQQAALPFAAPAPEQLAAVFEQPQIAPPPFLAAAAAPGAPKVCVQCGTTVTPMWRTVSGLTYCNADGLRLKRKLGLL